MSDRNGHEDQPHLPGRWEFKALRDIAAPRGVKADPKGEPETTYIGLEHIEPHTMRLIGSTTARGVRSASNRYETGDVLYSRLRPYLNKVIVAADSGLCSGELIVLTTRPCVDSAFLAHRLNATDFVSFTATLDTGDRPRVKWEQIGDFLIAVPPLEEQGRIVERIEGLRGRISAAVVEIEHAQTRIVALRRSTSNAAVGGQLGSVGGYTQSGDDVVARIAVEMERLKTKRTPKKPSSGNGAVHRTDFGLPRGWSVARWGDVGLSQNGRAFPSADYSEDGIRLLRPGNLHASGEVRWEDNNTKHLPAEYATSHPDFIVRGRELVINLTAQSLKDDFLGRVCLTGPGETCLLNQRIARLTPVLLSPEYVFCVFRSPLFRRYVAGLNKGSLIQHIFTSEVAEFVLPIPPLEEQERIVSELRRYEPVFATLEEVADAARIRSQDLWKAALHKAFRQPATA